MDGENKSSGYGKRPLWQWVLIYVVIGLIVYGLIYYFVFAKKGGYSYTSPQAPSVNQQTSPSSSVPAAKNSVQISNFSFSPAILTVKVGDTVTWTNQDSAGHSATADDKSFDTGIMDQGKSGTVTFNKAGTYAYHCSIHPSMHGTIIVQ
ncbi:MAG: cupredoxin family copper-binding protein [Candidatus Levyibacteriota bacterium]